MSPGPCKMAIQIIEAQAARSFGAKEKWALLSPFLEQHGREALAYATLQGGMEYFIDDCGYLAFALNSDISLRPSRMCIQERKTFSRQSVIGAVEREVFARSDENCSGRVLAASGSSSMLIRSISISLIQFCSQASGTLGLVVRSG